MFVDNKNLLHTGKRWNTPAPELMNIVTGNLSLWDSDIWTTGGLLERSKQNTVYSFGNLKEMENLL
eukprot:3656049-Ditylum_brightwellii.AAC.2